MNVERDPDEVFGWMGFSPADPACLLALLSACVASGADLGRFEFVPEIQGALGAEELRRYADHFLERGEILYSRVALEDWEARLELFARARTLMPVAVALGVAEAECVRVLDDAVRRVESIARVLTPVPEDMIEPPDREIWPDIAPELPLRAARLQMDLIGARARAGASSQDDRQRAREWLASLRSDSVLTLFEDASRLSRADHDADDDPSRDRTLMDALAIREFAGELYALTGDEELLGEVERVDESLDTRARIHALFAVAPSRWRTDQDRAPSPEHWWGVRTDSEENAPSLLRGLGATAARPVSKVAGPVADVIPHAATAGVRDPGAPYHAAISVEHGRLAAVFPIEAARERLGRRWESATTAGKEQRLSRPRGALAASDAPREVPNFVWTAIEGQWVASLNRLPTDDTTWELTVIGLPAATRVMLCDVERDLANRRAQFSYVELTEGLARVEHGMGVLAVEIHGEWALALLPTPEDP